jgi:hypothetical protein
MSIQEFRSTAMLCAWLGFDLYKFGYQTRGRPDFTDECRRQSRLAALADTPIQDFMEEALADQFDRSLHR